MVTEVTSAGVSDPSIANRKSQIANPLSQFQFLWLLRAVRVLRALVHLQLAHQEFGHFSIRQHAFDRRFNHAVRMLGQHVAHGRGEKPAGVERVGIVFLLIQLRARHLDLAGIDDDDEVAIIEMRRKICGSIAIAVNVCVVARL